MSTTLERRVHQLWREHSRKSDIAKVLLDEGYSKNEIAKAVPMAYSQVHSISRARTAKESKAPLKRSGSLKGKDERPDPFHPDQAKRTVKAARAAQADVDRILRRERANEAAGRPAGTGAKSRVGKLRTGNLPHDIDVGECANCGYDLVVRGSPVGYFFIHVNVTAEEYLRTVQFCQAVPKKLL